jgi:hypothetical protein
MSRNQLKNYIEKKVGFSISTVSACRRLEKILYDASFLVSYSSLSRIFLPVRQKHETRISTLDVLSNFLGYSNYEQFRTHVKQEDSIGMLSERLKVESFLQQEKGRQLVDYLDELYHEKSDSLLDLFELPLSYFFESKHYPKETMDYFLSHKDLSIHFFKHFVLEDDIYGHYQRTLSSLSRTYNNSIEFYHFNLLYTGRKKLLKGFNFNKIDPIEFDFSHHYHLNSRYLEMQLFLSNFSESFILEKTNEILFHLSNPEHPDLPLAYVGRWCRGLIYTNQYLVLRNHVSWKSKCQEIMTMTYINKEFHSVIYAFLVLTYECLESPMFISSNSWTSSKFESHMLLCLANGNLDGYITFKNKLGYVN